MFISRKRISKCKGNGAVCHPVTVPRAKLSVPTQRSCNRTVSPGLCPAGSSSRCLCPAVGSCRAACVEPREPQAAARRPAVSTKRNSLLLLCRPPAALSPSRPPPCPAPGRRPDGRRACPQPRMGPAAVTVRAESQRFGNLRFVVTSHFVNLLRVNWILQWEIPRGALRSTVGVPRAQDGSFVAAGQLAMFSGLSLKLWWVSLLPESLCPVGHQPP